VNNSLGKDNIIVPFEGRTVNPKWVVHVYRNLNKPGKVYSVRQRGRVVGHTDQLMLRKCEFIVSKAGQKRLREKQQRNVHAWVRGYIATEGGMGTTAADLRTLPAKITYDPYTDAGFVCENLTKFPIVVKGGDCVIFNQRGVTAAYIYI